MPGEIGLDRGDACFDANKFGLGGAIFVKAMRGQLHFQLCTFESFGLEIGLHELARLTGKGRERSELVGESLGVFERAFEDEPGDGVDIDGGHVAAQAHSL